MRIVKGANLAMEQFEASLRDWSPAPYLKKSDVDANYKKMVTYGSEPEHAQAVHLGIASHNLFDIAYALVLKAENNLKEQVHFEMLEGMADHIRRVVQKLDSDILLYCPVATKEDFQSAIAYLIRRLDENTGPDNFLRAVFGLKPGTPEWETQVDLFQNSFEEMQNVSAKPQRQQDRNHPPTALCSLNPFENEADTDFSLEQNRLWAESIAAKWHTHTIPPIPLVIAGKEVWHTKLQADGFDPSRPSSSAYHYALAEWIHIDAALQCAKEHEAKWGKSTAAERCALLAKAAQKMRQKRGDLIGVMMLDGGKSILEADPEVSEAIDFAEYYLRSLKTMDACKDIAWEPKGTVLIAPPWRSDRFCRILPA
jgi:RHH-type proline utilization regulon transcriptional repressor/proline dehydrogenase/delta 1-pyrroline-5-carboxylate dehydrogenase